MNSDSYHLAQRKIADEPFAIISELAEREPRKYVGWVFGGQPPQVTKWLDREATERIQGMYDAMTRMIEDNHFDLALRALNHICAAVNHKPVPKEPKAVTITTFLRMMMRTAKESADVQGAIAETIEDGVATSKELNKIMNETVEAVDALNHLKGQIEFLTKEAKANGGQVVIDIKRLNKEVMS